jgi:hypothetical protein
MADREQDLTADRETVVVERGSGAALIAAIGLLIAAAALLHYFDLLPF